MIYTWENRSEAFEELIMNYPGLAISDEQEDFVQMEGTIFVNRRCEDYRLSKEYGVRLIIFKDENNLPEAYGCMILLKYIIFHMNIINVMGNFHLEKEVMEQMERLKCMENCFM